MAAVTCHKYDFTNVSGTYININDSSVNRNTNVIYKFSRDLSFEPLNVTNAVSIKTSVELYGRIKRTSRAPTRLPGVR